MGFNFRKSIKIGPARINLSKSGVGYSVGAGGVRYSKKAGDKKKKQGDGFIASFVKLCFYLLILTVAAYLVTTHWKVLVALAAIAAAAAIGYQIYIHKQIHPKTKDDSELQDNGHVS